MAVAFICSSHKLVRGSFSRRETCSNIMLGEN